MKTTVDALLDGLVTYEQPAEGYRVALEAPLLARFAIGEAGRPVGHAIDLAAGCGGIGLMLGKTGWARRVTLVEVEEEYATLASRNVEGNGLASVVGVVHENVANLQPGRLDRADLVVSNPPWFETSEGDTSPLPARAAARAFIHASFLDFVRAARAQLAPRGRVVLSMPASRTTELIADLTGVGLHPKRMRFLHPRLGREAQVLFVEAKPGKPGGVAIEAPLFVRGPGEEYSDECWRALRGRWPTAPG